MTNWPRSIGTLRAESIVGTLLTLVDERDLCSVTSPVTDHRFVEIQIEPLAGRPFPVSQSTPACAVECEGFCRRTAADSHAQRVGLEGFSSAMNELQSVLGVVALQVDVDRLLVGDDGDRIAQLRLEAEQHTGRYH